MLGVVAVDQLAANGAADEKVVRHRLFLPRRWTARKMRPGSFAIEVPGLPNNAASASAPMSTVLVIAFRNMCTSSHSRGQ